MKGTAGLSLSVDKLREGTNPRNEHGVRVFKWHSAGHTDCLLIDELRGRMSQDHLGKIRRTDDDEELTNPHVRQIPCKEYLSSPPYPVRRISAGTNGCRIVLLLREDASDRACEMCWMSRLEVTNWSSPGDAPAVHSAGHR